MKENNWQQSHLSKNCLFQQFYELLFYKLYTRAIKMRTEQKARSRTVAVFFEACAATVKGCPLMAFVELPPIHVKSNNGNDLDNRPIASELDFLISINYLVR